MKKKNLFLSLFISLTIIQSPVHAYQESHLRQLYHGMHGLIDVAIVISIIRYFFQKKDTAKTTPTTNAQIILTPTTFADVAGAIPSDIVDFVDQLNGNPRFKLFDIKPPKGILLVGPPGTGKTLLARAIAGEVNGVIMYAAASSFIDKYAGQGAARIRELFEQAQQLRSQTNLPVIIFIDEIDAINTRGTNNDSGETQRTIGELLNQLDGFVQQEGIHVLFATNRSEDLDPAIKRSGRIDQIIEVPLPDREKRNAVLAFFIKQVPTEIIDKETIDYEQLTRMSEGFNNADLQAVVNAAKIHALKSGELQITQQHLELGIEQLRKKKAKEGNSSEFAPMSVSTQMMYL